MENVKIKIKHMQKKKSTSKHEFNAEKRLLSQNITYNLKCFSSLQSNLIHALFGSIISIPPIERNIAWKKRSEDVWTSTMLKSYDENQWLESFRMSKTSFQKLADLLRPFLKAKENPISVHVPANTEKKLAVTLYKLGSNAEYRVVGNVFGIHKATVKLYFYETVIAINKYLLSKYIIFPKDTDATHVAVAFEEICGLPQVLGCIDGTHIPALVTADGCSDFTNRKGWTSVVLQAVVNHKCMFQHISCKFPGSVHDMAVLKGSSLYKQNDILMPQATREIDGKEVGYFLLGDGAYMLMPWLMKGYTGTNLSFEKDYFNASLSSARIKVEHAFGLLKGRFRMLSKRADINHTFMPKVVAAACILHNFIQSERDPYNPHWSQAVQSDTITFPQPSRIHNEKYNDNASNLRDHLCKYLLN